LLFDLGRAVAIAKIQIQTSLPGWSAEIRVADQDGSTAKAFSRITTLTAGSDLTTVTLPAGTRARFVLLWITTLTENHTDPNHPFSADVNEIQFFAP